MCSNRFDLTQKLNDNFKELIAHCETIQELESLATPLPSQIIDDDEGMQSSAKDYRKGQITHKKKGFHLKNKKNSENPNHVNKYERQTSIDTNLYN